MPKSVGIKGCRSLCAMSAVFLTSTLTACGPISEDSAVSASAAPSSAASSTASPTTKTLQPSTAAHAESNTTWNRPLNVLSLGDSVPAGRGATSYVDMVASAMAGQRHTTANLTNQATDGEASQGLVSDVAIDPEHETIAQQDVIIIEMGANDFDASDAQDPSCSPVQSSGCYDDTMTAMRSNMDKALTTVKQYAKPSAKIILLGYWNVFKDGAAGQASGSNYVSQGEQLAKWVNEELYALAKKHDTYYADVYTPFAMANNMQDYLQADGDHPNDAGHLLIANAVLKAFGEPEKASV